MAWSPQLACAYGRVECARTVGYAPAVLALPVGVLDGFTRLKIRVVLRGVCDLQSAELGYAGHALGQHPEATKAPGKPCPSTSWRTVAETWSVGHIVT